MAASTDRGSVASVLRAAFLAVVVVAVVTNVAVITGSVAALGDVAVPDVRRHLTLLAVVDVGFGASVVAVGMGLARRAAALTDERQARRLRALVDGGPDLLAVVDGDGRFTYVAGLLVRGASAPDGGPLMGARLPDIVAAEDADRVLGALREISLGGPGARIEVSFGLADASGMVRHVRGHATNHRHDPAVAGVVVSVHDVTDQRRLEEELAHQAFMDSLTGLANRALFRDRVDSAIARLVRSRRAPTLLFIDLDDFKTVNDSYGHAVGDALLTSVADDLRAVLREGDAAARLGGDEFAILLEDNADEGVALLVARRLRERLARPRSLMGLTLQAGGSVGIAAGQVGDSTEVLLRNADIAMYAAKRGGDGIAVFEPTMHSELLRRLRLREDFNRTMVDGGLDPESLLDVVDVEAVIPADGPSTDVEER